MGKPERRAYLEAIRVRYRPAGKTGKSAILNEFCAVCSYHRKYALRQLSAKRKRGANAARKPDPASRYVTPDLVEALRTIWMASDQLCSKRLKAALPLWLPYTRRVSAKDSCRVRAQFNRKPCMAEQQPDKHEGILYLLTETHQA